MKLHEKYMSRCIQLAKNGLGSTYPNPLVGSVIVYKDQIIGEGWHQKAGQPHAEVNAISSVADPDILKTATLYVNLEPCSHFGKTPPCSNLIIEKGIRKVVIGSTDPNPMVAGRGITRLQESGCEVISGVLEKECNELNKRFFTFHSKNRPYVFLKWAQTRDGFIAPLKAMRNEKKPVWITNRYSRQLVHKMRAEEMAILVGTNTVLEDNPSLTVRDWTGKNPIRAVIDKKLKLPSHATVFDGGAKTYIITSFGNEVSNNSQENQEYIEIDFSKEIASQICAALYEKNIHSLIIEGGTKTLQTFIDSSLWDEAFIFIGPESYDEGILAPDIQGAFISETLIKEDRLQCFKNTKF